FNTLEFRQAVAYAINRPAMLNTTFQGLGELYNSSIYRQSPYYLPPTAGLPVYTYDRERARELLKQGGFQYNPQGQLADADGNPVRFTLLTSADNRIRRAIATQVQQDLSQVGITVDLQFLDISALVAKLLGTLDWEAHISHFVGGSVEPDSARNIWSVQGTFHIFNQDAAHGDPLKGRIIQDWEQKISDLYIAGSQELDEAKRREIYAQIQTLAQNYLPVIYLIAPFAFSAIRNDIENIRFSGASWRLWNVYELKFKQAD
ncbi:MAG TPA: ABC transporter substrate-binding protein, partial [Allocoleopsis sp.]